MLCPLLIATHFRDVLKYSGLGFNRFGSYHDCIDDQRYTYNFLTFYSSQSGITTYDGLCLPKQCNKNIVFTIINDLLIRTKAPLKLASLETDEDIANYSYPITTKFWLTIAILMIVFCLIIVATLFNRATKNSKFVSAFNIYGNLQFFKYNPKSKLNVINGIKTFSMLWVIFGHSQSFILSTISNPAAFATQFQTWQALIVQAGLLAVDTFFYIGGILLAVSFLRQESKGIMKYILAVVHRILRYWPCYIVTILIYYSIFMHLGKGPVWKQQQISVQFCQQFWRPLIFIDNLVGDGSTMCLGWGWYIQNDMQIFVCCIFLLLILSKNRLAFYIVTWLIIIGSTVYTFIQSQINGYKQIARLEDFITFFGDYFNTIYIKPWARCPPYLIGLLLGVCYTDYVKYEKNKTTDLSSCLFVNLLKIFKNRILRIAFQILGIAVMIFIIFIPRTMQKDDSWPQICHSLYLSLGKSVFVIGISMAIIPSMLGIKSFISDFLDIKLYSFIGKISFSTYLVHLLVIFYLYGTISIDFYYSINKTFPLFWKNAVISMFFGFVLCLTIELPFSKLQKHYLGKLVKYLQYNTVKPLQSSEQKIMLAKQEITIKQIEQMPPGIQEQNQNQTDQQKVLQNQVQIRFSINR